MKKFKKGFSIKEVTLSILIVSIIATFALIIFIDKYKTSTIEAQIKKAFSTLNLAALNANTMGNNWTQWGHKPDGSIGWDSIEDEYAFYETYMKPYVQKLKTKEKDGILYAKFTDGSFMHLTYDECINFHVDINGNKGTSRYGFDKFVFDLCPYNLKETHYTDEIVPHGLKKGTTRAEAIQMCKESKEYCGMVIYMDSWKISKDYPHKI